MISETRVTRELDRLGIPYTFMFDNTSGLVDGMTIAEGLKADPNRVFKTLILGNKKKDDYFVFMVPVNRKIDLKKIKALTGERLSFAQEDELAEQAGYEQGGCSPVATKNHLKVFFDRTAEAFDKIIFGAGENGYHIEVRLDDLGAAMDYELADIT